MVSVVIAILGFVILILGPLVIPSVTINISYPYLVGFATLIYISFVLYFPLYRWRGLNYSLASFVLFSINVIFFLLMLLGSLSLFFGLSQPIRIEDLPITSFYRYYIFFWFTIIII